MTVFWTTTVTMKHQKPVPMNRQNSVSMNPLTYRLTTVMAENNVSTAMPIITKVLIQQVLMTKHILDLTALLLIVLVNHVKRVTVTPAPVQHSF